MLVTILFGDDGCVSGDSGRAFVVVEFASLSFPSLTRRTFPIVSIVDSGCLQTLIECSWFDSHIGVVNNMNDAVFKVESVGKTNYCKNYTNVY